MRVVEYLHKDPDEYESWEMRDGKPRWSDDVHGELQYRLYEVKVVAELDEATGAYEVKEFQLGNRVYRVAEEPPRSLIMSLEAIAKRENTDGYLAISLVAEMLMRKHETPPA